jgi:hypothetical protein
VPSQLFIAMSIPWLRLIDTLIGVTDFALTRKTGRRPDAADPTALTPGTSGAFTRLETHLTGVVVAALKEAFDRDSRRLDLEREQIEAERQRAERVLRLELFRQACDREVSRLQLLAGTAVVSWIGTLFFSTRLIGGTIAARVALGCAWAALLAALASTFTAQSSIGRLAANIDLQQDFALKPTVGGSIAPWLIILGLALAGLAVLI